MRHAVLLAAILMIPGACAQDPAPVSGDVSFGSDVRLDGLATFSTRQGALDLGPATARGEPYVLAWAHAEGVLVVRNWTSAEAPVPPREHVVRGRDDVALSYGPGSLRDLSCQDRCEALLVVEGAGEVSLAGASAGPLAWLAKPAYHWAISNDERLAGSYSWTFPPGTLAAGSPGRDEATPLSSALPGASGRARLFLQEVTGRVDAEGGGALDTLTRRQPVSGLSGVLQAQDAQSRFVVLDLDGVSFAQAPRRGVELLAAQPDVALEGTLRAASATGQIDYDGRSIPARDAPLVIDGRLALHPATAARSALPGGALPEGFLLHATLAGEATRVQVGEASHAPASFPAPQGAAQWALLTAALAALAWAAKGLFAPLYSRITRDRALANPNRSRIRALIVQEPGITAAQLRRATGLARVVVGHHLRVLREHALVASQRDGRRRRYFPPAGEVDPVMLPLHALLQDATRRKVVVALAGAGAPLTQRELVARTGISQRLLSYHLAKLASAGAVGPRGARPIRYVLERDDVAGLAGPRDEGAASGAS